MKILLKRNAYKQHLKIPQKQRIKIEIKIETLVKNSFPYQSKKLSGRSGYRLRIGDYRVLYYINKKEKFISILSVQHRKDAYR